MQSFTVNYGYGNLPIAAGRLNYAPAAGIAALTLSSTDLLGNLIDFTVLAPKQVVMMADVTNAGTFRGIIAAVSVGALSTIVTVVPYAATGTFSTAGSPTVGDAVSATFEPASATTPLSSPIPYLSAAEFIKRCDQNVVAMLCSDSGTRVTVASLPADPNLAACLLDASGDVEAACMVKQLYSPADLAALTGATQASLFRIIHDLAWWYLYDRRKDMEPKLPVSFEKSMNFLKMLSEGTRIFGILEVAEAGVQSHHTEHPREVTRRESVVTQNQGYYGRRANRENYPRHYD
jgi:hypothetical protein